MTEERTYRMYGFVPYSLSGIQKGIQFGHAVVEFGLLYGESEAYKKWASEDKTFIVLNGGTTNDGSGVSQMSGSLNQLRDYCKENNISFAEFTEPDLGDQLTAFVFLVDDRAFDYEAYPHPRRRNFRTDEEFVAALEKLEKNIGTNAYKIRELIQGKPLA